MGKVKESPGLFDQQETPVEVSGGMAVMEMSPGQRGALETITQANVATHLANAKAMVEFAKGARVLAITNTENQDWCMFGDKPHLCESGVKKTIGLIRASVLNIRVEEEVRFENIVRMKKSRDEKGKVTEEFIEDPKFKVGYFTATGEIHFKEQVLTNIGTASTKDDFFARRKNGDNVYHLDYDEVDKNNVKKKSMTNLSYRLLDMLLKLNPTKERLKELGIEPQGKVGFGKGSKGGTTDTAQQKDERGKLRDLVLKTSKDNDVTPEALLQALTSFDDFPGYKKSDRVSVKMLSKTIAKFEKKETIEKAIAKAKG